MPRTRGRRASPAEHGLRQTEFSGLFGGGRINRPALRSRFVGQRRGHRQAPPEHRVPRGRRRTMSTVGSGSDQDPRHVLGCRGVIGPIAAFRVTRARFLAGGCQTVAALGASGVPAAGCARRPHRFAYARRSGSAAPSARHGHRGHQALGPQQPADAGRSVALDIQLEQIGQQFQACRDTEGVQARESLLQARAGPATDVGQPRGRIARPSLDTSHSRSPTLSAMRSTPHGPEPVQPAAVEQRSLLTAEWLADRYVVGKMTAEEI